MKSKLILKKKGRALVIGNTLGSLFRVAKSNQRIVWLLFLIITAASLFVRFWNYQDLVNFHGDAPFYLHEVKDMLDSGKIRLVGPMVISKIVFGRGFFTGPLLYYVLAVLGILTNWNIVMMTVFFTLLWTVAMVLMFFWMRQKFGVWVALPVYAIFSLIPTYMLFSRTMWNPHFVPVFGILFLWFLDIRKRKTLYYLLSGLFFGLALNVHYSVVIWIPIIIFVIAREICKKEFIFRSWLLFSLGVVLAEFPLIVFELRHNFYNLSTIIYHLRYGGLSEGYTFAFPHYYIFPALPLFGYLVGAIIYKTKKTVLYKPIIIFLFVISLLFLKYDLGPIGQEQFFPSGWNLNRQKRVAEIIKNDQEDQFEVAAIINSDTRASEIRWWLRMADTDVMGVDEYDIAPVLYLVAPGHRSPENETVWEVRSMQPFEIEFQKDIGEDLFLYKLVRISNK